jgi:hypothetical protein
MEPTEQPTITVTVVRTGGFAGIRREWNARPPEPERPRWLMLIRQCPWDAADESDAGGADRFVWHIEAQLGDDDHRAEVPETRLHGPWRDLVAEVQSFEQERQDPGPPPAP